MMLLKKLILLFLLPLPFPSHRKNVKQNILTETNLLNKSAQSSFEPDSESSFKEVNFYVLKMGNSLSHTTLIPHLALTLRPMVCECLRSCITINQTFLIYVRCMYIYILVVYNPLYHHVSIAQVNISLSKVIN